MIVSFGSDEVQSVGGDLLQRISHTCILAILCAFETVLLLNFMATFIAMTYIRFLTDDSESEPDSNVAPDANENRGRAKTWFDEIIVSISLEAALSLFRRFHGHTKSDASNIVRNSRNSTFGKFLHDTSLISIRIKSLQPLLPDENITRCWRNHKGIL